MVIFSPSSRNCLQHSSPKNQIGGFWGRREGGLCTCIVFAISLFVFFYSWMDSALLGFEGF